VLRKEYPRGVDIVYESVGGDMFQVAADALANKGRLIVIGMMSQYGDGWQVKQHPGLPEKLLKKSATIAGTLVS
jgi:NADPH-dependent curcumin reductase CurA